MRALVLSNLYPPDFIGGYELHCSQVVQGLRRRGHDVDVLTARSPAEEPDPKVHRRLRLHPPPPQDRARLRWQLRRFFVYLANLAEAWRLTRRIRPHVVLCWSPARIGLAPALPAWRRGAALIAFVDDWSVAQEWRVLAGQVPEFGSQRGGATLRLLYSPLRRLARGLCLDHAVHVSAFVERSYQDQNIPMHRSCVVHQAARFVQPPLESLPEADGDSLVYVGRIEQKKAPHVAVEALGLLRTDLGRPQARLLMVGRLSSEDPAYVSRLRELVDRLDLNSAVEFAGPKTPAEIFELLPQHQALLFTSGWPEPGPATVIEALGHGVPVISTDVGGMRDYVRDATDGFIVPRGDSDAMAVAALRLLSDEGLRRRMRLAGWERVADHFQEKRLLDDVEEILRRAIEEPRAARR